MEKTVYIDEKPVRLKSTAALPKRYKAQFRRDYFADLLKIAKVFGSGAKKRADLRTISFDDLNHFDMDVLYDIVWTMAKSADRTIPDPMEWLDGFETFPLKELLPEIKDLLENSMQLSKLFCNKLFFAVCKGGDDHFEFIAGECPEEAEHKLDGKE